MSSSTSRLVVLAGPTAVGKGTVAAYVRRTFPDVWVSVSMTTRKARPREIDGVHYHFVDDEQFERMRAQGEFLEWAVVHGRAKYGTPRGPVDEALAAGAEGPLTLGIRVHGRRAEPSQPVATPISAPSSDIGRQGAGMPHLYLCGDG